MRPGRIRLILCRVSPAGKPSVKLSPVGFKKIMVHSDVFQLRPGTGGNGAAVHIVNHCVFQSQQEGRVGSDDQLAAVEAHGVLQKLRQFQLQFCREAVFRLIQQIQAILCDLPGEV